VVKDDLAFRFDCGAPWLNLLATSGRTFSARPVERIATPGRLADWLAGTELAPDRSPDPTDVEQAQRLRETLRALAMSTVDGNPPPPDALHHLTAVLTGQPDPILLEVTDGRLRRNPPADTTAALARLGRQAADHLTGPQRHHLSVCGESDCRGIFADPTGRRHWCPAPACASRGRVRALRARRAATDQT
jgi:predicted RNA-binding Zn ribbon-like protein